MKKIQTLAKLPTQPNVLFLLKAETHKDLEQLLNSSLGYPAQKDNVVPDSHDCDADGYGTYSGATDPYQNLANVVLADISRVFDTDWKGTNKVAVYIHYHEKNILTAAVQSISRPHSFCCVAIDEDQKVRGNNIFAGYVTKGKIGGYAHYMDASQRLLIISDCLEGIRQSSFGYLVEEAIDLAKEVISVTPDLIHSHFATKNQIQENVFQVESVQSA